MSQKPFTRLARWLGFDRNPLRRRCDRIEAITRLIAVMGVAVAVVLGILFGARAYGDGLRAEAAQAHSRHLTRATMLQDVPARGLSPSGVAVGHGQAEWTTGTGVHRTGVVEAPPGKSAGDVVLIWTDDHGAPVRRPQDRETTVVGAITVGAGLPTGAAALLALLVLATRTVNQRRATRVWEAQWSVVEPMWRINGR
ncbi:hypothetical protein [Microtetraspora sp. NBRC 16547]|uniref:Rv1733c family protein n=1 Tax=Microtetraspora sp. NBRC 16547 TaxID=3030993 RepID=UPI0024A59029|nr:hypothetical protein [Microtetraspora sp. NBRC 16547]GLX01608.1 hypothetical protein Misp02_56940 [Microtetraspora sp. NBRC 16547]